LEIQHSDGGWRCNKFSFGSGPETEYSNPSPTLAALDAIRFTGFHNKEKSLENAVEFLLEHWTTGSHSAPAIMELARCLCKLSILLVAQPFCLRLRFIVLRHGK